MWTIFFANNIGLLHVTLLGFIIFSTMLLRREEILTIKVTWYPMASCERRKGEVRQGPLLSEALWPKLIYIHIHIYMKGVN